MQERDSALEFGLDTRVAGCRELHRADLAEIANFPSSLRGPRPAGKESVLHRDERGQDPD
jgi:hypothetical protein